MSDNSYIPDTSWDLIRWAIDAPFQSSLYALHQPGLTDCGRLHDDLFLHEKVPYVLSHVRDKSRYSYQPRTIYDLLKSVQAPWICVNQNQKSQLHYGMPQTLSKQTIHSLSVHEDLVHNGPGTSKISWVDDGTAFDVSRHASPRCSAIANCGSRNPDGSRSCAWPRFASRCICNCLYDWRKHYRRHSKTLLRRHRGCLYAIKSRFSTNKDRSRHEVKHNPKILCT
jgi:hypothetical protein